MCVIPYIRIKLLVCVSTFSICAYKVSLRNGVSRWSCLVCTLRCLCDRDREREWKRERERERDNSTPGHWSAPDPRGQEFWPLGSSQRCAHRAAGRLGLLHSVYKHTHTHTLRHNGITSDMSERVSMCTHTRMAWGKIKLSPLNDL